MNSENCEALNRTHCNFKGALRLDLGAFILVQYVKNGLASSQLFVSEMPVRISLLS